MKKFIITFNIFLALGSFFLDNNFLAWNGYLIYLFQFSINLSILIKLLNFRAIYLFLPSLFSYLFVSINLILGGYLTPRGFGFFKRYAEDVTLIKDYNLFTPYILLCLAIFYYLSLFSIPRLNKIKIKIPTKTNINYVTVSLYAISLFLGLPFGVQLGFLIIILHCFDKKNKAFKMYFYVSLLALCLIFYSFDKRNIIVVLFLILLFEGLEYKNYFKFKALTLVKLFSIPVLFIFLVILASIKRGYGNFDDTRITSGIKNTIEYSKSDYFVDAITDNLELNYNYGATFVALDYVNKGVIDYQYGLTLIKPLFFLVSRDFFPDKPQSFMHLYTQKYQYEQWLNGSSLPVILPVDLYGNFHYLGLVVLFFIYKILDQMYAYILKNRKMTFKMYACVFFVITHLLFIRGGGLDLYILYFLFALPGYVITEIGLIKYANQG